MRPRISSRPEIIRHVSETPAIEPSRCSSDNQRDALNNLKVHHARKVKAWVASHAHEIELFYLPAYAPEHNPDEYLNHAPKQALRPRPQPGAKGGPGQKHPLGAARYPAVALARPGLLHARGRSMRRLKCQL